MPEPPAGFAARSWTGADMPLPADCWSTLLDCAEVIATSGPPLMLAAIRSVAPRAAAGRLARPNAGVRRDSEEVSAPWRPGSWKVVMPPLYGAQSPLPTVYCGY